MPSEAPAAVVAYQRLRLREIRGLYEELYPSLDHYIIIILLLIVLVRLWRCVWVLEKTIGLVSGRNSGSDNTSRGDD
jgi:hypothetical protein